MPPDPALGSVGEPSASPVSRCHVPRRRPRFRSRRRVVAPVVAALVPSAHPEPDTVTRPAQSRGQRRVGGRVRALGTWARGAGGDAGSHGLEVLGRVGLVAYGVLHLLLAALAAQILWGARGVRVDQDAAVALVAGIGPAGAALLAVAVVALVSFGLWQARAALIGFRWTTGGERFRKRFGAAAKAVAMFSLASIAIPPAVGPLRGPPPGGPPPPNSRSGVRDLTGSMLSLPAGWLLVASVAVVALSMAVAMVYTSFFATYLGDLHAERLTPRWRRIAVVCGSYGNLARALLIGSVGVLFAAAAVTGDPRRSGGFSHALRFLGAGPWGVVGLAVVVLGVGAFGCYCFIDAYARRA